MSTHLPQSPPIPTSPGPPAPAPVTLEARLDAPSRGLWLVKWLLLIPHYLVLAVLVAAVVVCWPVALVAILVTGRYPRVLFDFVVGVMRWGWRVSAYGYGLLGTDRYPPFTLDDVPDYPARLTVRYPERLSRGLVLVKWWLLALPHLIIVGLFFGGLFEWSQETGAEDVHWQGPSLVGLLVFAAGLVLLFRARYPVGLFDLVMGLQRWGMRVAAYELLLTDVYPPFRLDTGGHDPAGPAEPPAAEPSRLEATRPAAPRHRWTAGPVVALVLGGALALGSGGLLLTGGAIALAPLGRDDAGYLSTPHLQVADAGYALTSTTVTVPEGGPEWTQPGSILGTLRARVTSNDPSREVFVGVARAADVEAYLAGVERAQVTGLENSSPTYRRSSGSRAPALPGAQPFWIAQASGAGTTQLTWSADAPDWVMVIMRADSSAGVAVQTDVGATLPALGGIAAALLIAGVLGLALGAGVMLAAIARAATRDDTLVTTAEGQNT